MAGKEWSKEEQALGLHGAQQVMLYDPAPLSAADRNVRATLDQIREWMASGVPLPPAGAEWETMPGVSVSGFTISVDDTGVATFQGETKSFPAYSYTATAPGEGLLRLVVVYAKPDGTYGVSVGDAAQNPVQPAYPATALFVTMMVVAPTGGIIQQPTSYVTSVTVRENGVDGPSQTGAVVVNLDELAPTQDIAYRPFPNTGAVTLNYATSPNWNGPASTTTDITVATKAVNGETVSTIPDGGDLRILLEDCAGQTVAIGGAGVDLFTGEALPSIKLPASGDCLILVNNVAGELRWSVAGTGGELPDMPQDRLLGRGPTAGIGEPQAVKLGGGMFLAPGATPEDEPVLNIGFSGQGDTIMGGVVFPRNSFQRNIGRFTGLLRIAIPFISPDFIVTIRGIIEEHRGDERQTNPDTDNKLTEFKVSGRVNMDGNWRDPSAILVTDSALRDLPVHYVREGNEWFVYLGDATTLWESCTAVVDVVIFARSGVDLTRAVADWVITQQQEITGTVHITKTDNLPYGKAQGNATVKTSDGTVQTIDMTTYAPGYVLCAHATTPGILVFRDPSTITWAGGGGGTDPEPTTLNNHFTYHFPGTLS